jgi:DNA-binding MarR family transcriptional regulator
MSSAPVRVSRTAEGEAATRLILATFRASGLLLASGGEVAAAEGLTTARWQVLGALALADRPLTTPQIARRMGLTRQSVHATVGHLATAGLLELVPNADHRRSALVRLTAQGAARYAAVDRRQAVWVNALAAGLDHADLERATTAVEELSRRLEQRTGRGRHNQQGG